MDPINAGDTTWVLVCSALVLMMTPALAFFYGGMVRKKNALSTLTLSFTIMGLISIQWVLYGYSLAFDSDFHGLIGGLKFIGLTGVGAAPNPDYAATIPHLAFAAFQMMFAIITPALITGAFVERVRFKAFLVFSLVWATLVYDPVAHWVWGVGGVLRQLGALDFAGGTVVHITAGFSALAFALAIGPRKGFGKAPMEPHNIPYTVLGAGLLWVGWFGFNAGSALAANSLAVNALVTTNTALAVGDRSDKERGRGGDGVNGEQGAWRILSLSPCPLVSLSRRWRGRWLGQGRRLVVGIATEDVQVQVAVVVHVAEDGTLGGAGAHGVGQADFGCDVGEPELAALVGVAVEDIGGQVVAGEDVGAAVAVVVLQQNAATAVGALLAVGGAGDVAVEVGGVGESDWILGIGDWGKVSCKCWPRSLWTPLRGSQFLSSGGIHHNAA